ncbi:MAG: transposase [Planctomycetota bacterium]|nr:transposase [Planctomycetota bacterium]
MTVPRLLLPKSTYLVTRRCAQRMFLLTPGVVVNRVFAYCLAKAAQVYSIEIHGFIVLSNHYHIVLSEGAETVQLPKFMRFLNFSVARALNIHYKRRENFWSSRPYSAVRLIGRSAVLDKLVYTLVNAVKAGLTADPGDWPGLHSSLRKVGSEKIVARRPKLFFAPNTHEVQSIQLSTSIPPQFADLTLREFQKLMNDCVTQRLRELSEEREAVGKGILGALAVLRQDPFSHPKDMPFEKKLNPRIACKDKGLRLAILDQFKDFYQSYREAWRQWKKGIRDVLFPFGSYLMSTLHGAHCIEPADECYGSDHSYS